MDESIASLDYTNLEVRVQAIMDDMKAKGLSFRRTMFDIPQGGWPVGGVVCLSGGRRGGSMFDKVWLDECARIEDLRGTKAATADPTADVLIPREPKPGDNVKNLRLTVLKQRW